MLRLYWARPDERNELQQPVPTAAFAQSYLRRLVLTEHEIQAVSRIIEAGTRIESGQRRFLFQHGGKRGATHKNLILCETLEPIGNTAMNSIQNESVEEEEKRGNQSGEGDDDDRAGKRPKYDTPS